MRARLSHYFPSIPALALYAATVVSEVPVIFTRMIVILIPAAILFVIKGGSPNDAWDYTELALIPTGWAILALITPLGGGWWWRTNLGGREPSTRERDAYRTALDELHAQADPPIPGAVQLVRARHPTPRRQRLRQHPRPFPRPAGNPLPHGRGRARARTPQHQRRPPHRRPNRLLINPIPLRGPEPREARRGVTVETRVLLTITLVGIVIWTSNRLLRFASGGFGLRLLAPFWGSYWREREYLADKFAASLGQAEDLADFLEVYALMHDQPVPLIWLTEHTHPPTELRVDRLRTLPSSPGAVVAEAPEPVNAAPTGPPAAGPDGPALTEPATSTGRSLTSAGQALPSPRQPRTIKTRCDI